MNRDTALLLGAAVAVALGFMLVSPWSPLVQQTAIAEGHEGTTWSPRNPRVPYYQRGGLYHPPLTGQGRSGLILNGWAWIADPPSEVTGPGVSSDGDNCQCG